ncbi:single-stranded DNA-binding protein [Caudoviricetes sp.]|nr:single-stranded DNA-binding protein [Caudoviricetes sp.]
MAAKKTSTTTAAPAPAPAEAAAPATEGGKKKRQKPSITPPGIAAYPKLLGDPDTKFKPEGVFSVKLKFKSRNEPGVDAMLTKFENTIEAAKKAAAADADYMKALKKKGKKLTECDRSFFIDEDTGEVTVNFKMIASGKSKKDGKPWDRRPAVFDIRNEPVPQETKLGSGSTLKIAYTFEPFYTALGYGCSIRLEAAQVIKLVEWGQGNAESYGFANEDAGEEGDEEGTGEGGEDADAGTGDEGDF